MFSFGNNRENTIADPPYISTLGLAQAPFSDSLDPRFFYADPDRGQSLNMLRHLVAYSDELLMVIGDAGVGKTALLEQFLHRADEDWKICRIDGTKTPAAADLFLLIAAGFGLNVAAHQADALLAEFKRHLEELRGQQLPILVVDDAHALSDEALEVIVRLAVIEGDAGDRLIRVALFAEPPFPDRLTGERFSPVPRIHQLVLEPLDEANTGMYLQHRLSAAGFIGENPFSSREIKGIYKGSQGMPERINILAHKRLMRTQVRGTGLFKLWPAAAVLVGVAVLAVVFLMLREPDEKPEVVHLDVPPVAPASSPQPPPAHTEPPAYAEPLIQDIPPPEPVNKTPEPNPPSPSPVLAETPAAVATPTPAPQNEPAVQTPAAPEPEPSPPAAAVPDETRPTEAPAAVPVISRVEPDPVVGSRHMQTLKLIGEDFVPDSRVTVGWRGQSRTLAADRVRVLGPHHAEVRLVTGTSPDTWTVAITDPQGRRSNRMRFHVTAPQASPAPPKGVPPLLGTAWLRQQPPGNYTLQLFASQKAESLRTFITEHHLRGTLATAMVPHDGKELHVLLLGSYPDREAALAAAARLPAAVRAASPWPRPIGDLVVSVRDTPPPTPGKPQGASWLWDRDPSHFTIQLIAAGNEVTVQRFIADHHPPAPLALFRTLRQGRPWHVLIYGDFPDREAARAAAASLPADLRRQQPWVRDFASIHAALPRLE